MAWNTSPEVAAARDFGKKFNAKRVIILRVNEDNSFGYVSYGKTRELCDQTRDLAEKIMPVFENELLRELGYDPDEMVKADDLRKMFDEFNRRVKELSPSVSPLIVSRHFEGEVKKLKRVKVKS